MAERQKFDSRVFVGKWSGLGGVDPELGLEIVFDKKTFRIGDAKNNWQQHPVVNTVNATLEKDVLSVSYWECGNDKARSRIMGMTVAPPGAGSGLLFGEPGGTRYSVWGCGLEERLPASKTPVFYPSFAPNRFLNKLWHVVVEHGDSGGRVGGWVKITRCLPRSRVFALTASWHEKGPWQLYDVLFYNGRIGSLESIYQHRSLCFWPKAKRSKNAIYAMFDNRTVGSSAQSQEIRLMPFEQRILEWTDGTGGAGVWGAEEGGGG